MANNINLIVMILFFALSGLMFSIGYNLASETLNELRENCKTCSIFDKYCPFTDKELLEQEYGGGKCGDMGWYEMKFKFQVMFFFGLGVMFFIMPFVQRQGELQ
jgi:hypothetical protein